MQSDGVCFEYAQSGHRRSAFYATPPCPMAMPLRCCGDACVRTVRTSAFCNFLGHRGITVRTPPWYDRGLRYDCYINVYKRFVLLKILRKIKQTCCSEFWRTREQSDLGPYCLQYRQPKNISRREKQVVTHGLRVNMVLTKSVSFINDL